MHKFKAALLAGLAALLSACSPFAAINLLVPRAGYGVHRGIAYGTDPRQKLTSMCPTA